MFRTSESWNNFTRKLTSIGMTCGQYGIVFDEFLREGDIKFTLIKYSQLANLKRLIVSLFNMFKLFSTYHLGLLHTNGASTPNSMNLLSLRKWVSWQHCQNQHVRCCGKSLPTYDI